MFIKYKGGFTILEALLVVFLLGLIFSMGAGAYNSWQKQIILTNARDEIKSALIRAHQLSVAVAEDNTWGIHLESDRYILFKGSYYNAADPENKSWILDSVSIVDPDQSFADGAGGYIPDVVFAKLTGVTPNYGTVSLVSVADSNYTKIINVDTSGQID